MIQVFYVRSPNNTTDADSKSTSVHNFRYILFLAFESSIKLLLGGRFMSFLQKLLKILVILF